MTGGGGGVSLSDSFGSEILAQSGYFGSMKDARMFLGRQNNRDFYGVAKKVLRDFSGYAKKSSESDSFG